MKRCPECRRDYYDDSLLYCLDDGTALLEGPALTDEPATAILSEPAGVAGGCQPFDVGAPKRLTNFKADQIFSFNWSSDNKLVISHGKADSDVVLIRNAK